MRNRTVLNHLIKLVCSHIFRDMYVSRYLTEDRVIHIDRHERNETCLRHVLLKRENNRLVTVI